MPLWTVAKNQRPVSETSTPTDIVRPVARLAAVADAT